MTSEDVLQEQLKQIRQHKEFMVKTKNYDHQEDKDYLEAFIKTVKQQDFYKKTLHDRCTLDLKEFNDKKII